MLPERFRQGAFIGQHGSWNRDPPSGYKVLFVPFADGKPNGPPITVLDGFLDAEGNAQAARWVWRRTVAAHCWWPTMWAM